MLTHACIAYNSREPISWDLSSSRRSPAYIRDQLRTVMHNYISSPAWHEESIPPSTIQSILSNWSFRDVPPCNVEIGPRRTKQYSIDVLPATTSPLPSEEPRLSIDGTNLSFVTAIALLKNHDQIPYPVLLRNFNTTFLDQLYTTYPNIELIPDTIAGVQSPDYILL